MNTSYNIDTEVMPQIFGINFLVVIASIAAFFYGYLSEDIPYILSPAVSGLVCVQALLWTVYIVVTLGLLLFGKARAEYIMRSAFHPVLTGLASSTVPAAVLYMNWMIIPAHIVIYVIAISFVFTCAFTWLPRPEVQLPHPGWTPVKVFVRYEFAMIQILVCLVLPRPENLGEHIVLVILSLAANTVYVIGFKKDYKSLGAAVAAA